MTYLISPGSYPNIIDLSQSTPPFPTNIGAAVFGSRRGTLDTAYISSRNRFLDNYGNPDASFGFGHYGCLAFLLQSSSLWCQRVVGTGTNYAGSVFINNLYYKSDSTTFYEGTDVRSLTFGNATDYKTINRSVVDIVFDADLIASNEISITINDVDGDPVTFATDNNTTLTAVAQEVQSVLDGIYAGGQVYVVSRQSSGNSAKNRIVRIITPDNLPDPVVEVSVSGGASQAGVVVADAEWLFFTLAENPGAWGNTVANQISSIDQGIPHQVKFSFSQALVTGNTVTLNLNGQVITQAFTTDNNATLTALCNAIKLALPGSNAVVTNLNLGVTANREIVVSSQDAWTDLTVGNVSVSGGASQALINYTTLVARVVPNGTFALKVVEGTNTRIPSEFYTATLYDKIDGFGNQLNIDYQLNSGPRTSPRIRVYLNPALTGTQTIPKSTTPIDVSTDVGYLSGGNDGLLPTSSNIINGWNVFSDPEKVTVRILINNGYSTPEVHQAMASLAEKRRDCFAVLDIPSDSQDPAGAVSYRRNQMGINSKYAACYTPDLMIFDTFTGNRMFVPPSGYVAAQYAYNDSVGATWMDPAGLNRGVTPNVLGLRYLYNEGDRDLMSPYQVNGIRNMNGVFTIWGAYTLQLETSALQSVGVVRLIIMIETTIVDSANFFVFEPNNPFSRYRLSSIVNDYLQPIMDAGGLYEFEVVCDDRNNTPQMEDARVMVLDVYLKPVLSALFIRLNSIVTKTSASFAEIITLRTNPNS